MEKAELANSIIDHSQSVASKTIAVTGGGLAVGQWLSGLVDWLMSFPWMPVLSTAAIILLVIERSFIVWAWNNRRKRGEL